jgi:hypothetical protein
MLTTVRRAVLMEHHEPKSQPVVDSGMSRRTFATLAAGGVGALVLGGVSAFRIFDAGGHAVRSFEVRHDPSVYVTMTNGRPFVVEVKRT